MEEKLWSSNNSEFYLDGNKFSRMIEDEEDFFLLPIDTWTDHAAVNVDGGFRTLQQKLE